MFKNLFIYLWVLLAISLNINAQDFGDIPDELLEMSTFDLEPDADAVIVFNKCDMRITSRFAIETERHVRIKVLTEEGKKYGDVKLYLWKKDEIYNLEAASYSKDGEETELEDDNIFEEEIGNTQKISFAIPAVEIGSVIEYKYTIYSEIIEKFDPWYFQDKNFTLLSKVSITLPKGYIYNTLRMNFEKYDITYSEEDVRDPDKMLNVIKKFTWTGKNIPGIKNEPYMDNLSDEYAKMIFIMNAYKDPYRSFKFAKSWDEMAKLIYKGFEDYLEDSFDLPDTLNSILNSQKSKMEKAVEIYDFIISKIKTTEHKGLYSSSNKMPEKVLEDRSGSVVAKTFLLIDLLRSAGIVADPVLISTRPHGKVIKDFVDFEQFNRMICRAEIDGKDYYLYVGNSANPFGYLVPNYNVADGLMIREEKGVLLNPRPNKQLNRLEIKSEGNLIEESKLQLTSTFTYKGYPAMYERNAVVGEDTLEHIKNKLKGLYELAEVDTFFYSGLDDINEPLELTIKYTLPDYIEDAGEMMYLTPPLFTNIEENPFKREKRVFDVCYDFPEYVYEKCKVNLPEGIASSDAPARAKTQIKDYTYNRIFKLGVGYVESTKSTNIKNRLFNYRYYPDLKSLYEIMVAKDAEQFVLTRTSSSK